jgi:prepilin-type N-terminal cleavage/methylation domain-containing protein
MPISIRRCAFTLLELLVAITLFAVVAVILLSFINSMNAAWQQGISHNERRGAAMSVFHRISRDLRHAALPTDAAGASLQFVVNPPSLSSTYKLAQAMFWQAPSATERSRGDLAIVGYFVQWADAVPKLCRFLANPSAANSHLLYASPGAWIKDSLLASDAPATRASGYVGQLAENVLGLWVRPLDQLEQPITKKASGAAFLPGQFDSSEGYISSTGRIYRRALPSALEVIIITVDSRTSRLLKGIERPGVPSNDVWKDVNDFYAGLPAEIRRGAEIHSTQIALNNAPR